MKLLNRGCRITGQQADCLDCDKTWNGYGDSRAQKAAYSHAKNTGHRVRGETVTAWHYN